MIRVNHRESAAGRDSLSIVVCTCVTGTSLLSREEISACVGPVCERWFWVGFNMVVSVGSILIDVVLSPCWAGSTQYNTENTQRHTNREAPTQTHTVAHTQMQAHAHRESPTQTHTHKRTYSTQYNQQLQQNPHNTLHCNEGWKCCYGLCNHRIKVCYFESTRLQTTLQRPSWALFLSGAVASRSEPSQLPFPLAGADTSIHPPHLARRLQQLLHLPPGSRDTGRCGVKPMPGPPPPIPLSLCPLNVNRRPPQSPPSVGEGGSISGLLVGMRALFSDFTCVIRCVDGIPRAEKLSCRAESVGFCFVLCGSVFFWERFRKSVQEGLQIFLNVLSIK